MPTMGFYGKLPWRGDFLQRRVPQEFVDAWDVWVRDCLRVSRHQLAERWLDAYLTGPVWRFALAGGLCGADVYAGVLLPSVDRVGRYFPLTIVARWEAHISALAVACRQTKWFEAAEALALRALDSLTLDSEDFDRCVAELAAEIDAATGSAARAQGTTPQRDSARKPGRWYLPLESCRSLPETLSTLATQELERSLRPLSLWWTDGSKELGPGMLCMTGLPEPGEFASMLSGGPSDSVRADLESSSYSR